MALGELSASLPPWQLRIAAGYKEAIQAELSAPQSRIVEQPREFLDGLARCWTEGRWDLVRERARENSYAKYIQDKKQWFFETDRQLASLMKDRLGGTVDVSAACDYIRVKCELTTDEMWVGAAARLSEGVWDEQSIIEQPTRFRVVHALAHLTFRQCVANSVEAADFERASFDEKKLIGAFRVKAEGGKGDWYDAIVVGSAVYADVFVARDKGVLRRCQYVREFGVVRFDVSNIDEIS